MAMTWEEKIVKAKESAAKKAEKDGLDEAATRALIDEAVSKIVKAKEAEAKEAAKAPAQKKYLVEVTSNQNYCGVGAGGVQFANGYAIIESARMAEWFREHDGYTVTEQ